MVRTRDPLELGRALATYALRLHAPCPVLDSARIETRRPRQRRLVMARIPIAPPGMKDQRPRYTLGWRVGNHIYVAGQLPFDKDGNLIGKGDIKAQTRRIFEQIKMIVEAGRGKVADVRK